jgi:spermidine synthase
MDYKNITPPLIRPVMELRIRYMVLKLFSSLDIKAPNSYLVRTLTRYIHADIANGESPPLLADVMVLVANLSSTLSRREKCPPVVCEHLDNIAMTFDMTYVQSEMRLDRPDELVLPYTQSMMCFLLFNRSPARIGMIGLGGGSMVKFCYRHLPQARLVVSEINTDVVALRNTFCIPADDERLRIVCGDGAQFIKSPNAIFDVLLIDGFDRHGQPPQLCSGEFYGDCWSALTADGMLVVNLLGSDQSSVGLYIERIQHAFSGRVIAIKSINSSNIIVYAWKGKQQGMSRTKFRKQIEGLGMLDNYIVSETARRIFSEFKKIRAAG